MIVLDIDGTLLNSRGQLTARVKSAVARSIARGALVTIATGRRLRQALPVAAELGITAPVIVGNGGAVVDPCQALTIYHRPLPTEAALAAALFLGQHGLPAYLNRHAVARPGPVLHPRPGGHPGGAPGGGGPPVCPAGRHPVGGVHPPAAAGVWPGGRRPGAGRGAGTAGAPGGAVRPPDGLEVCRAVRQFSRVPILILTARKDEVDRVVGLEVGADDYVTKPFSPRELASRVKAILRRSGPPPAGGAVRFGSLRIDFEAFAVTRNGEPAALTVSEFRILQVLVSQPGRVFTREELLDRARGTDFFGEQRTVDVHLRHLRAKLEPDSSRPQLIETVRGVGYRFRGDPARPITG